jgi:hypothetical protein
MKLTVSPSGDTLGSVTPFPMPSLTSRRLPPVRYMLWIDSTCVVSSN